MAPVFAMMLFVFAALPAGAAVMAVAGEETWAGTMTMTWQAAGLERVTRLDLRLPLPGARQGWGWRLEPGTPVLHMVPSPAWQRQTAETLELQWHHQRPQVRVEVRIPFRMVSSLQPLQSAAPYPLESVAAEAMPWLQPTPWVDPAAVAGAVRPVVAGAGSAVQALVEVAAWLRGHFSYRPAQDMEDAHTVVRQGGGDIVGLVHLWLAALRAVGLPARAVVGVDGGVDLAVGREGGERRIPGFSGLVPWLEVWLPDLGWVAVDPRGLVGWLPPGRVPVVLGADVPAALETATVRWRHVAGVAVAPRFSWEAQLSVPSLARIAVRADAPGPSLLLPAPPAGRKPLRPRTPHQPQVGTLCPPAMTILAPGRYLSGQVLHPEAMAAAPRLALRLSRSMTNRAEVMAQPITLSANATISVVELALWRERGSGQLWVELVQDANPTHVVGAPGERIVASRPRKAEELAMQPGWVPFVFPPTTLPPGRYWIVPQFSGSLQARWLLDPVPLSEELGMVRLFAPGQPIPLEARGLMRLCP